MEADRTDFENHTFASYSITNAKQNANYQYQDILINISKQHITAAFKQ